MNRHFHRADQARIIRQQQFRLLASFAHASVPGEVTDRETALRRFHAPMQAL